MSVLDRIRGHIEVLRASGQALLWIALAAGLSLTAAGLLEPLWPLRFLSEHLPGLLTAPLEWLGLSATTALIVYGILLTGAALAVFGAAVAWARAQHRDVHAEVRESMVLRLLALVGFVCGFVGARAIVVAGGLAQPGVSGPSGGGGFELPFREIWIQGYHVHHFFFGFLILAVVSWIAVFHPGQHRRWLAALYGIGMGVFVDEWGLLVTWGDYYARSSWFIAVLFLAILVTGMLWTWERARDRIREEMGIEPSGDEPDPTESEEAPGSTGGPEA